MATSIALYSELEFKTLLARLRRPSDLPLFDSRAKIAGDVSQLRCRRSIRRSSPRLAREIDALAAAERVAFASLGDAIGVTARERRGDSVRRCRAGARRRARRGCAAIRRRDADRRLRRQATVARSCAEPAIDDIRFVDDAMIAAHLLDPSRGYADIEDAAAQFLGLELPDDAGRRGGRDVVD